MEKEIIKAFAYECNYKDFSKATNKDGKPIYDWGEAVWSLFNAKNAYTSSVLKLDVLQRGKDDNGFYQNYIYLLVKEDSDIRWDDYLKSLGYGFTKDTVNVEKIILDWYEEPYDDFILEVE